MRALKRVDAWINRASLRAVDDIILIQQINEEPPQIAVTYGENPGWNGQRLLQRNRTTRRITITFQLRELYDLSRRARVIDAINGWAQDGILQVSYRSGQQIRVYCVNRPTMGAARDVLEEYTIGFEAAVSPFWEDAQPVSLSLSGTDESGTLFVPGTEPCRLTTEITPTGGTLTEFTITAGGSVFAFSGLDIAQDTPIKIAYTDDGYLTVSAANTSLLPCRSAASADDLLVSPGVQTISFEADVACDVTIYARGLWK